MEKYLLPEDDGLPIRPSGDWAQDKLFYVKHYIDTFEKSMRNSKWRSRIYIDLFAGPGKCKDRKTKEYFLGSPLLALTTEYPFVKYFFADMDNESLEALKTRSKATKVPEDKIHFLVGDANEVVYEITKEIRRIDRPYIPDVWPSLNLAFLDPNGVDELKWNIIAELAQMKRMDLIIHYSQQGVERLVKNSVDSPKETALDRFFGDSVWRDIYIKNKDSVGGYHRPLINYYKFKLKQLGYMEVKDDEEIWTEPLMRNQKNAPLYRLLFASKSELGVKFWKDITRIKRSGQIQLL
jgi:three-Cys-motif partner protein